MKVVSQTMEIIIGIVVGTVASVALSIWANRKNQLVAEEATVPLSVAETDIPTVPLEKRLRDALYDCERLQHQCDGTINEVCQQLLDLLKDVGRISYVEVKDKPIFFAYQHPLTQERHYYYERDLKASLETKVLEQTRTLAQQYQQHLEALVTQRAIFKQLTRSHQENINRLNGVKNQGQQAKKIADHQVKLANLKGNNQSEENAIYNQLLLKEIEEEVGYQEECMRQYIDLSQTHQRPLHQPIDAQYQDRLQHLLNHIETEDPSNSAKK